MMTASSTYRPITRLGIFAVAAAAPVIPVPVLNFVLSATQTISQPLAAAAWTSFSLSVSDKLSQPLAIVEALRFSLSVTKSFDFILGE